MKLDERTKLIIILALLSVATVMTVIFHIVLANGPVFTQFFYVPLTVGAIWYRKWAYAMATYLGAILITTDLYIGDHQMLVDDLVRTAMFYVVVAVVAYMGERLFLTQVGLESNNALLESEVAARTAELRKANVDLTNELKRRQEAEASLAEERERLVVTLSSIGDGVIVTDTMGRVVMMNANAERLTGRSAQESLGKDVSQWFPKVDGNGTPRTPTADCVIDGQVHDLYGLTLLRSSGDHMALSGTVAPIKRGDEVLGAITVLRDESEMDRVRSQISRANRVRTIELMAGGVAHDLKNILTVLSNNVDLIRLRVGQDERVSKRLDEEEKAIEQARELTQQMMALAKAYRLEKKRLSLGPLVRDTVAFHLRDSNVRWVTDVPDDTWQVSADGVQIREVISNLVINARQEMASGGMLTATVRNEMILPDDGLPLAPGRYVRVSIADQGGGIGEKDLERIFEPYYTTKKTGKGLGLAISNAVVQAHKGHIAVESKVGQGTTFYVYLPAENGTL